ncbi:hypothetical protein JI739_02145 [Ramlibacter sp. AW1]|uniref:Uncharacterized protein n=1 Tax=Ramlibacter aurantiacus TaxID=2801330 RepID=A0A936ZCL4_9BURK|nr:hypothetical protein [Ramlibacter aurantiacus]MBL0419139.1 hypothetical protein [Ramlibacter aurantiacus]
MTAADETRGTDRTGIKAHACACGGRPGSATFATRIAEQLLGKPAGALKDQADAPLLEMPPPFRQGGPG